MAHLTLWSRSARPGSDLPWTIERTYASHYIASMGVPIDGSTVTLEGRLWIALPAGSEPSSPCASCGAPAEAHSVEGEPLCEPCAREDAEAYTAHYSA